MIITTPIPESIAKRYRQWRADGIVDSTWQILVTIGAVAAAIFLSAAFGSLGIVFAFIILYFLFREPIQDALADIWERDFWRYQR